ncbi:MAG: hypothetical protein K8U57_27860 [Planctomycetes bacterium]|nr:hypothetical protein [Planctomycetota bacterium]
MSSVSFVAIPVLFSLLNRARGSQFWDTLPSTSATRILATLCMAVVTAATAWGDSARMTELLLWTWASLMLWCVFAWDNYWSAAIGNPTDVHKPACKAVDRIMARLPAMPLRLWGAVAMGIRQSFAVPCLVGLSIISGHPTHAAYALATLSFGLIYLAAGYVWPKAPITVAEHAVGAALGALIYQSVI